MNLLKQRGILPSLIIFSSALSLMEYVLMSNLNIEIKGMVYMETGTVTSF